MKHTPGPWLVSLSGPTVYALHGQPNRNRFSALVSAGRKDDADPHELMANARLIAAAPDLLEALKHAVDWLNAAGIDEDLPVQIQARAAIAKATGSA